MHEVTHILNADGQTDPRAASELLSLVYEELRRLAAFGSVNSILLRLRRDHLPGRRAPQVRRAPMIHRKLWLAVFATDMAEAVFQDGAV